MQIDTFAALGKAVRAARQARGLSLDALARQTAISKPYLSNIETARSPGPPSDEKLRALERALDFPADSLVNAAAWVRTPPAIRALLNPTENPPRNPDGTLNLDALLRSKSLEKSPLPPIKNQKSKIENPLPLTSIPLINRVAAGFAAEHTNLDYPAGVADSYLSIPAEARQTAQNEAGEQSGDLFATRVQGDSMQPNYIDGEVVVVCDAAARDGDDCLIRLDETENFAQTLKRIYFVPGPTPTDDPLALRLVPLNPDYPERTVPLEHVTALYPVMWKVTRIARGSARPIPPINAAQSGNNASILPAVPPFFDEQLSHSISG